MTKIPDQALQGYKIEAAMEAKRIAIITGATSGLGLEFVRQLDAQAARGSAAIDEFWLVARNKSKLDEIAGTLTTPARAVAADLSKSEDIAYIAELLSGCDGKTSNANGPTYESTDGPSPITDESAKRSSAHPSKPAHTVTYLVNSAGFGRFGSWRDISDADATTMIELDCRAVVEMTRTCLPFMERGARIIEIASAAGFVPLPYMNVYAAAKSLVLRYTRGLRWELHGTGITATALCPTWVKTGFEAQARKSNDGRAVNHLLFAQSAKTVVKRALIANRLHFAVACCSIPSLFLRLVGKIVPNYITMWGWNLLRRL